MTLPIHSITPPSRHPRGRALRALLLSLTLGGAVYAAGTRWSATQPVRAAWTSIMGLSLAAPSAPTPVRAAAPAASAEAAGRAPVELEAGRAAAAMPAALAAAQRRVELGRKLFFDTTLSEPAGTSCASCHEPSKAYSGNHGSKLGVALGSRPGHYARRNTPSLLYLKYVRKFHWHWEEDAPFPDAVGGFFWDGRADSIKDVARQPLLNADEMGNVDAARLVPKLRAASYAEELTTEYALRWDDHEAVLQGIGSALEAFLTSDELSPFSSKYDDFVRGTVKLSDQEQRGLALFRDGAKGGCDVCHRMNEAAPNPERSLFTDYGFEALAVPRNHKAPHNRDRKAFDRGLCEPDDHRHFPMDRETWCSNFRTASLRNVAVRERFMHNGVFRSLREVVLFYVTRGTTPKRWYKAGTPFDDVPARYRDQVQIERVPYDRGVGEEPRMNADEIDAVVAFLKTLTDKAYVTEK